MQHKESQGLELTTSHCKRRSIFARTDTNLMTLLFWTGDTLRPNCLAPIQSTAQIQHLSILLATHLFPTRGGDARSN